MNTENNKTVWDFVEKFYPKYQSCDDIAHCDDLQKIVDKEETEGDCADNVLQEIINEGYSKEDARMIAETRLKEYEREIYQKAIEGYIEQQKTTYFLLGSDAVKTYLEEGIDKLIEGIKDNEFIYDTLLYINGETPIHKFAEAISGYHENTMITQADYNKILEI